MEKAFLIVCCVCYYLPVLLEMSMRLCEKSIKINMSLFLFSCATHNTGLEKFQRNARIGIKNLPRLLNWRLENDFSSGLAIKTYQVQHQYFFLVLSS